MSPKADPTSPDAVFKALGSPARLILVRTLIAGERCVCDLVEACGLGWSTTSKHLDVLREAGVVSSDRRGQNAITTQEINLDLHGIIEPAEDVDIVPALFVITPRLVIVNMHLMLIMPVQFLIELRLQNIVEHRELTVLLGSEGVRIV